MIVADFFLVRVCPPRVREREKIRARPKIKNEKNRGFGHGPHVEEWGEKDNPYGLINSSLINYKIKNGLTHL